jgi:predicted acetyltransferase
MREAANPDPHIQLVPAGLAHKPVLANLLELYTHDFCDFLDLELRSDGRFGYKELDLYWSDPDRHPFLVYIDEKLAGFVLVDRVAPEQSGLAPSGPAQSGNVCSDVAEFFILRSHRRRGLGTRVVHQIFRKFPGAWQVRVRVSNPPACRFWKHAIAAFAGEAFRADRMWSGGADREVFWFESPGST